MQFRSITLWRMLLGVKMTKNKPDPLDEFVVERTPPGATQLTGEYAHPKYYTTTLYDDDGKLVDDGNLEDVARSYWEEFVEPGVAQELEDRLALLETDDYYPNPVRFTPMEDLTDGQDDEE